MGVFGRVAGAVVTLMVLVTACGSGGGGEPPGAKIPGVVFERASGRTHREAPINYPGKHPPSGGDHYPAPVTCGYYDEQPPDELAVHSLEHGAVWIAYDPSLSASDVAVLRPFASKTDKVLVTPYKSMDAPITLLAWQYRLEVQSVTDARIKQFVDGFHNASSAPEKNVPCVGQGEPAS